MFSVSQGSAWAWIRWGWKV